MTIKSQTGNDAVITDVRVVLNGTTIHHAPGRRVESRHFLRRTARRAARRYQHRVPRLRVYRVTPATRGPYRWYVVSAPLDRDPTGFA